MRGFRFRRKNKIIDLTEKLNKRKENLEALKSEIAEEKKEQLDKHENTDFVPIPFFNSNENSENQSLLENQENEKKLLKKLTAISNKLEDLSNEIYHMQQRIELIEKKLDINKFD